MYGFQVFSPRYPSLDPVRVPETVPAGETLFPEPGHPGRRYRAPPGEVYKHAVKRGISLHRYLPGPESLAVSPLGNLHPARRWTAADGKRPVRSNGSPASSARPETWHTLRYAPGTHQPNRPTTPSTHKTH
ncbi:hypothetical protein CVA01_29830 [Corynebacterium variabile]|uniref:Uncharacterized protein n=1 Tax=Corynebacterium variabile TaxID=1727 RepID=A0A4Y4C734_9CORY|nr:hypothetical protein CVA01_29830 [Corynebacterium variabile]